MRGGAPTPFGVKARKTLARTLYSKARFLLPDRHVPIPGPDGRIYLNLHESRMMIHRALRVYEHRTARFMRSYLAPGMTAIDVGANMGDSTLLFARSVGVTGRVVAFEPDPESFHWLQKGVEANGYQWVELSPFALSDHDGTAAFYPGLKSGMGSLNDDRRQSEDREPFDVPIRRLDDVLADIGIVDADLIKVDVEGAELGVLKGSHSLLSSSERVTLIIDVDAKDVAEQEQVFDFLRSMCGLEIWDLRNPLRPLRDLGNVATIVASRHHPGS